MSKVEISRVSQATGDTEQLQLVRGLGLLEATTIIMGGIIGSGIFRAPSLVADAVGSPGMSMMVWIVCGFIAMIGGLCIAEMASAIPKSGGSYVYLREAYDEYPIVSFLYGWGAFWVLWPVSVAAVAVVFATYLTSIVHTLQGATLGVWTQRLIAVGCVMSLTLINCIGVRRGGQVTNLFTLLKIFALGGLIVLAMVFAERGSVDHFTPLWGAGERSGFRMGAFGMAMITALFAYEGWTFNSYVAEEIKNPTKNLSRSIIIGVGCVIALYLLANLAYMYVLPFDQFRSSEWVAADTMEKLVGPVGALLIAIGVLCSTFGSVNVQVLVGPRIHYALAKDGMFFKGLTRVHPRYRTPANSIFWQGILTSLFALSGRYDVIISYGSFTTYFWVVLVLWGVTRLRKKRPDLPRPYKVWGYPITPIIVIGVLGGYLYTLVSHWDSLVQTLIGLGITLTGIPFYFYWKNKKDRQLGTTSSAYGNTLD